MRFWGRVSVAQCCCLKWWRDVTLVLSFTGRIDLCSPSPELSNPSLHTWAENEIWRFQVGEFFKSLLSSQCLFFGTSQTPVGNSSCWLCSALIGCSANKSQTPERCSTSHQSAVVYGLYLLDSAFYHHLLVQSQFQCCFSTTAVPWCRLAK